MKLPTICVAFLIATLLSCPNESQAVTHDLALATGILEPSFRGPGDTTYLGWDEFGIGGFGTPINNNSPDIGTGTGSIVTTNGEDHTPISSNYYSFFGSVAEDITFETAGTPGAGFTTIIIQAVSFGQPGPFGSTLLFGNIDSSSPTVLQTVNAAGLAHLWAKYEVPGNEASYGFSLSSDLDTDSHVAIDQLVIDTYWSLNGYAPDVAISTPEPVAACLATLVLGVLGISRRR